LADGIYAEWGSDAWGMQTYINYSALAGVRKPVAIWTVNDSELTDDYMQRCLYLGIFPTAPYPNNNHCLRPSQRADEQFLAYGPLLNAMRARKWVLEPHCIVSTSGRSNLFSVPGGYVAPVTHAGEADYVTTRIRSISGVDQLSCDALHPGAEQPVPLSGKIKDGVIELSVPLVRGCAMIRLKWNVTA
jgi:hypothetical protein